MIDQLREDLEGLVAELDRPRRPDQPLLGPIDLEIAEPLTGLQKLHPRRGLLCPAQV